MSNIHYSIQPASPEGHVFRVVLTINAPSSEGHRLQLPNWIPGSYMIRDFAKNIVTLSAKCDGKPLPVHKLNKHTWQLAKSDGPVEVHYDIYAWDLSVRSAHLDQTHAYFNGTSVFLKVLGHDNEPVDVTLRAPKGEAYKNWRVATSLKEKDAKRYDFGTYRAENYDDLIDQPVEMADFSLHTFEACGVPHDFVLVGQHRADMARICEDLKIICEHQIRFFGEPAPVERYVFMTYVLGDGYGGLEHRASTSLHCSRADLPLLKHRGQAPGKEYIKYLGLCSHEYFHTWNVKRIKPARFLPYDLTQETPTELLWAFEGITSYFDDLTLVHSGIIDVETYLDLLSQTITRVWRAGGRHKQTVTESSFDAWTRFYKQDENSANAIVSYYTKGSLIALAIDLKIREVTAGKKSLQDVMQILWRDYGQPLKGVPEQGLHPVINAVAGTALDDFVDGLLYTTDDVPLAPLLQQQGVHLQFRARANASDNGGVLQSTTAPGLVELGANYKAHGAGVQLTVVFENSAAQLAGLSAGDVIIAIDHLQVQARRMDDTIQSYVPGDRIVVHAFRRDELMVFSVVLKEAELSTCYLTVDDAGLSDQGRAWLNPPTLSSQKSKD